MTIVTSPPPILPPPGAGPGSGPGPATIAVFVIHPRRIVCAGLLAVLSREPGLAVLGTATSVDEALPALDCPADRHRPRIVLVTGRRGLDADAAAVRRLRRADPVDRDPPDRYLVLERVTDRAEAGRVLLAGAHGALPADTPPDQFAAALATVAAGGAVFLPAPPPPPSRGTAAPDPATEPHPRDAGLTGRERAVLALLGRGLTNAEIAREMVLAEATIKRYLTQAMRKIGQPDRLRAGLYAYRHGLA